MALVRDWDSDGRLEALAPSTDGVRLLPLAEGDAAQELSLPVIADYGTPTLENYFRPGLLAGAISWPMFELADDDGDGRADLFAANRYELRVFRAGADGLPREPRARAPSRPSRAEEERRHLATTLLAFVRDLDGDGRADLVVHRMVGELMRSRSTTTIHTNAGAGADPQAAPSARIDLSGGNAALRVDDIDGDGRFEILEAYLGFGVVQAIRMLTLRSAELQLRVWSLPAGSATPIETWSDSVSFSFDLTTSRVVGLLPFTEADWNGDGRLDLCWADGGGALRFRLGEARPAGPGFGPHRRVPAARALGRPRGGRPRRRRPPGLRRLGSARRRRAPARRAQPRRAPGHAADPARRSWSLALEEPSLPARPPRRPARPLDAEMLVGAPRRQTPARRPLEVAALEQEGLDQILERAAILADRGRERVETGRAAVELLDQGQQQHAIELVEADLVDVEALEREACRRRRRCRRCRARPRSPARGAAGGSRCAACRARGARSRRPPRPRAGPRAAAPSAGALPRDPPAGSSRGARTSRSGRAAAR